MFPSVHYQAHPARRFDGPLKVVCVSRVRREIVVLEIRFLQSRLNKRVWARTSWRVKECFKVILRYVVVIKMSCKSERVEGEGHDGRETEI